MRELSLGECTKFKKLYDEMEVIIMDRLEFRHTSSSLFDFSGQCLNIYIMLDVTLKFKK